MGRGARYGLPGASGRCKAAPVSRRGCAPTPSRTGDKRPGGRTPRRGTSGKSKPPRRRRKRPVRDAFCAPCLRSTLPWACRNRERGRNRDRDFQHSQAGRNEQVGEDADTICESGAPGNFRATSRWRMIILLENLCQQYPVFSPLPEASVPNPTTNVWRKSPPKPPGRPGRKSPWSISPTLPCRSSTRTMKPRTVSRRTRGGSRRFSAVTTGC